MLKETVMNIYCCCEGGCMRKSIKKDVELILENVNQTKHKINSVLEHLIKIEGLLNKYDKKLSAKTDEILSKYMKKLEKLNSAIENNLNKLEDTKRRLEKQLDEYVDFLDSTRCNFESGVKNTLKDYLYDFDKKLRDLIREHKSELRAIQSKNPLNELAGKVDKLNEIMEQDRKKDLRLSLSLYFVVNWLVLYIFGCIVSFFVGDSSGVLLIFLAILMIISWVVKKLVEILVLTGVV